MVRFTLRQLEYVLAVAQEGGIAQAARRLNISQPSVAQALDKLEERTGLTLFERRHARGMTATVQGRQFVESARALLDHAVRLDSEAAALAAHMAGEIRVGCFLTIASFCFPGLIRAFGEQHPAVTVFPTEGTLEELAQEVREHRLDACITYDIGETLTGLQRHYLADIRPTVILSSQHPLADRVEVRLADLTGEDYVLYDAPGSREYYTDLLVRAGLSPRIGYASRSLEGVRSAVAAQFGFSIAAFRPPYDVTYEGRELVALQIADPIANLRIVLAMRSAQSLDPVLERFANSASVFFAKRSDTPDGWSG